MAKIVGVNGIYNWSWDDNTFPDKLRRKLEARGYETVDAKYPRMWALAAYFNSAVDRRAMAIVKVHDEGDHILAHSFGGWAAIRALQKGVKAGKVFLFAPAAEVDFELPEGACERLYVIHSKTDRALKLGKRLPDLCIPFTDWCIARHPFGALGLVGYQGKPDARIENVCADGLDHNDHVKPEHIDYWVNFIAERI